MGAPSGWSAARSKSALAQSARFGRTSGKSAARRREPGGPAWGQAVRQTGHRVIIPQSGAAFLPGVVSGPSLG